MATRTPTAQPRNQFNRDWGNYAASTGLPNGSGNSLANPFFTQLEVGDTAYVTGTQTRWVCTNTGTLSGANATWAEQASGGGPSSNILWQWNGTDLTQFNTTPTVITGGTPVSPTITFAQNAIRVSMAVGSSAQSAVIYWVDPDIVPWNSVREIEFIMTSVQGGPAITDDFMLGVIGAGDESLVTGVVFMMSASDYIGASADGGGTYSVFSTINSGSSSVTVVRVQLPVNVLDTAAPFAPNGVPRYIGTAQISRLGGPSMIQQSVYAMPGMYTGTDWGPAVPERIGIIFQAPNGIVDANGITLQLNSITFKGN